MSQNSMSAQHTPGPAAYVNGDELDNMLDDRTATIQGRQSNYRRVPLYRHPAQPRGPHPDRFGSVAWNMAPTVMPTEIRADPKGGATRIVYECGHSGEHAAHFHHTLADKKGYRCGVCGKARASKLPEFAGWFDERGNVIPWLDKVMARIDEYAASYHVDAVTKIDGATTAAHRAAIRAAIAKATGSSS